jgi:hypothetical protein
MSSLGQGSMRDLTSLGDSIIPMKLKKVIKACSGYSELLKSQLRTY